jgi:signal transduction histidine kinase
VSIDVHEVPDVAQQLRETCHDMRQPIANVLALAAAALTESALPAPATGRLQQIVGQAEWLADMIQAFLRDVTRGEAADASDSVVADESAVWTDAISIVDEIIEAGRLTWRCDVKVSSPGAPVRCAIHPVLLRRIVSNVMDNAARAAGPAGLVTIEIQRHKRLATLVVEDSGPGFGNIPSGAGLGLFAVARHIVRHGGTLECGRGAGGGARVSLCLPRA